MTEYLTVRGNRHNAAERPAAAQRTELWEYTPAYYIF